MRAKYGVDANESSIIDTLESVGATVEHLGGLGHGTPDLLVGYQGKNYIVEVKDPNQPASKQRLRENQIKWHQSWRGQVCVVTTPEGALELIGLRSGRRNLCS